jgi:ankyrin repeat protein
MLEMDPELITSEDGDGYLPIHVAALNENTKSIELLLKFDPDAASKETNDGSRCLPLHLACSYNNTNISSIQVLYDAYPDAILARNNGRTPLDLTRNQPTIDFLQTQLVYARQAQDTTAMATLDENGWLPLHFALKDDASLGSIKLSMSANPAAMQVADQSAYSMQIQLG